MKSSGKFQRKALLREAKKLAAAGRSVIPVHGDNLPEQPKKPAIAWRRFQREIMGSDEIDFAFRKGVTALGIVCGRVSRLIVVDFDDMDGYARFCRRFPGLVATRTVKTRRGCHLYFGTAQKVPSHQFDGGDIKGERSYVLAPPSRIANVSYAVVKDLPVRELSPGELGELLNHLGAARQLRRVEMRRAADHAAVDVARFVSAVGAGHRSQQRVVSLRQHRTRSRHGTGRCRRGIAGGACGHEIADRQKRVGGESAGGRNTHDCQRLCQERELWLSGGWRTEFAAGVLAA